MYKQIFGTPIGSPLSSVVANMVMQDFKENAIRGGFLFGCYFIIDMLMILFWMLRLIVLMISWVSLIRYTLDYSSLWKLALMEK